MSQWAFIKDYDSFTDDEIQSELSRVIGLELSDETHGPITGIIVGAMLLPGTKSIEHTVKRVQHNDVK